MLGLFLRIFAQSCLSTRWLGVLGSGHADSRHPMASGSCGVLSRLPSSFVSEWRRGVRDCPPHNGVYSVVGRVQACLWSIPLQVLWSSPSVLSRPCAPSSRMLVLYGSSVDHFVFSSSESCTSPRVPPIHLFDASQEDAYLSLYPRPPCPSNTYVQATIGWFRQFLHR